MTLNQWLLAKSSRIARITKSSPGGKETTGAWYTVRVSEQGKVLAIGMGPNEKSAKLDAMHNLPGKYR